jgi:hypothetical protein
MSTTILLLFLAAGGPEAAQPALERTQALLAQGDFATASLALTDALADDPENVDALQAAALVALRLGDPKRAVEYLSKVLDLDPNNDDARLDLARAQYLAGDPGKGEETLSAVLDRHPRLVSALTLDKQMRTGTVEAPVAPSPWRLTGRAGIAAILDTNLSLDPGTLPNVSNRRAGLMNVDVAASLGYRAGPVPVTVFAQLTSNTPFSKADKLAALAPTTVDAGVIAKRSFGDANLGLDARYQELFTATFDNYMQRLVSPSLFGGYRVANQDLRLLGGIELRRPTDALGTDSSLTTKASLRDTASLGRLMLVVDLSGRLNQSNGTAAATNADFREIAGMIYGEYGITAPLAALLMVAAQARQFDQGLKESTYTALGGARYTLGTIELHAEYSFSKNLSDAPHSYDRHQVTAGVRAYYE